MERFVCIHGHFYQPPRENPWLEEIEVQDSAYPYHDWNEKITAECYAPNSASRLLDEQARITHIVGNYAKMSFNFGPTLLSWMQAHAPETYEAVLEADKRSIEWRGGHGSALAQVYNHVIMPLANKRDKNTQVIWGIKDFEHRFKRAPEGMWLSETAVDTETLDVLAEHGIQFTILSPHQAGKVRKIASGRWKDLSGGRIDPSRAYLCKLPSGRRITLFFYDGPISKAVAFEKLLEKGEDLANRILGSSSDERQWPQLLHIATDGESYGHHHKFGDMALAYAMHFIEWNNLARLTNYGEYLENNPPTHEVQIIDNTSWSCAHGVERWRSDCGCNTGGLPGWNQKWRAPLREALDWLRDEITPHYERKAKEYLKDPWAARDGYVDVILDRSASSVEAYLKEYAQRDLGPNEKSEVLQLLEMQRHAMLMYTSCGWFFTELSGVETVQVIQYAGRTIQLAEKLFGLQLESTFMEKLSMAKSNIPENKDGAEIYRKMVKPGEIDCKKVAIHYAISSLLEDYEETTNIFSYSLRKEDYKRIEKDGTSIAIGKVVVTSGITHESETISFCAQHLGKHYFNGGLQTYPGDEKYQEIKNTLCEAFEKKPGADIPEQVGECFGTNSYSLKDLFMDEKRKVLKLVTTEIAQGFEESDRTMYENNRALMNFIREAGIPVPKVFLDACEFTLNLNLLNIFKNEKIDADKIKRLIDEVKKWDVPFDTTNIEFALRRRLETMMCDFLDRPDDASLLPDVYTAIELAGSIPIEINLWHVQNIYFKMVEKSYKDVLSKARGGDAEAAKWIGSFKSLGEILNFNTSAVPGEG